MMSYLQHKTFSAQELLAALQAQIIYMIMRFVDGALEPGNLNQQLVVTYQVSYFCASTIGILTDGISTYASDSWASAKVYSVKLTNSSSVQAGKSGFSPNPEEGLNYFYCSQSLRS